MITVPVVKKAIGMMSLMKFFPGDEDSRAALMELLGEMCASDEQVIWLARRMRNLYAEWPGAHELRAVLCSKYRAQDGIDANSAVYLDGVPSEKPELPVSSRALPPGGSPAGQVLRKAAQSVKALPAAKDTKGTKLLDSLIPHGKLATCRLSRSDGSHSRLLG